MTENMKKVHGVASTYKAIWVQRSNLIRLTASGILPCYNYEAALEKRPERVQPPMWDMVFYIDDVCQKAIKPFDISVYMTGDPSTDKTVIVHDATGDVVIPVTQDAEEKPFSLTDMMSDKYVVYSILPVKEEGHIGCIVVPEGSIVLGIYYHIFGPASKEECEDFVNSECNTERLKVAGGETPWPFINK